MNARIYGDFAVKFRAFGIDFGYAKRSISAEDAAVIQTPVPLPATIPIVFEKFGIRINAYISKA